MKYLILSAMFFILHSNFANAENCNVTNEFVAFKAGIEAENSGDAESAFNIFCDLAYQGDYRAQFKLANYFSTGIEDYIEVNLTQALVWAQLSNSNVVSKRRSDFILSIINKLTEEQLQSVSESFAKALNTIPSGQRIDKQYDPLVFDNYLKNKKKTYMGSRLKKEKAPADVGTVDMN